MDNGVNMVENHCISYKVRNEFIVINPTRMQENYMF